MPDLNPQDINAARPFKKAARIYRRKGWIGTVPLPPREKHPPPTNYTGRGKPYPDDDTVDEWIDGVNIDWSNKPEFRNLDPRKANIGLRLGPCTMQDGSEWDVVGIDVDDYTDGDKRKEGAEQLRELETRLGALPPTFVSSSREGASGIRFFRASKGHVYRGKASKDIDVVSPGYRFTVVYPSYHPNGGQYRWHEQLPKDHYVEGSDDPDNVDRIYIDRLADVPDPCDFPVLPQKWFEFLTNGGTVDDGRPIDMDASKQEIMEWARKYLPKPPVDGARNSTNGMCTKMVKAVDHWKKQIDDSPSSHDKVINSHWHIISLATEGHSGWEEAIQAVEDYQDKDVAEREKRTSREIKMERFRSKINGLRKKKALWNEARDEGIELITKSCTCFDDTTVSAGKVYDFGAILRGEAREAAESAGDGSDGSGRYPVALRSGQGEDPSRYSKNDIGNADHFDDLYGGHYHWVAGYDRWMFWDGVRWILDDGGINGRAWRLVVNRLEEYSFQLRQQAAEAFDEEERKRIERLASRAMEWATKCGDNRRLSGAMEAARALPGVSVHMRDLDGNPNVLGLPDGEILELGGSGVTKRLRTIEDLVTKQTAVSYVPWDKVSKKSKKAWQEYLDQFIPDPELRDFVQKVAGYSMIGSNPNKMCVFLLGPTRSGKSTFLDAIMGALGEYAGAVDMDMFRQHERNPSLVDAIFKRVITASEVSQANVLHADVFKKITGGDPLKARKLFSNDMIEERAAFLAMIATNNPPSVPNADNAVLQRMCTIPFDEQAEEKMDAKRQLIEDGLEAIFSWMVEGYVAWRQNESSLLRANWPQKVKDTTGNFFLGTFDLGEYIADRIETAPTGLAMHDDWRVSAKALYVDYEQWCAENRVEKLMTPNKLSREMSALGRKTKLVKDPMSGKNSKAYVGMRLKPLEDAHVVTIVPGIVGNTDGGGKKA